MSVYVVVANNVRHGSYASCGIALTALSHGESSPDLQINELMDP